MTAHPPRALHLPDLPDVAVAIGDGGFTLGLAEAQGPDPGQEGAARPAPPIGYRLRQALLSYLPLLLMALLALSTGWLIKNTPHAPGVAADGPPRQAPDYTMTNFSITRYAPDGQEVLRIAGDALRHYPLTDRLEIDGVRIHATAPDGRTTDASARQALSNADGSEVQLLGGARVTSQLKGADALALQGEFFHAFLRFERLRSHLPVLVRRGGTETRAGGLEYDHLDQQLKLLGPVRSTLLPGRRSGAPVAQPGASAAARP